MMSHLTYIAAISRPPIDPHAHHRAEVRSRQKRRARLSAPFARLIAHFPRARAVPVEKRAGRLA